MAKLETYMKRHPEKKKNRLLENIFSGPIQISVLEVASRFALFVGVTIAADADEKLSGRGASCKRTVYRKRANANLKYDSLRSYPEADGAHPV